MSSQSIKRILKEYKELTIDNPFPDDCCTISTKQPDDYYTLQATLVGPPDTPYEDGLFFLDIELPSDYPFKPPKVKFTTSIYHCNISEQGQICLDILKEKWSPASSIRQILNEIINLLAHPNPSQPLRSDVAQLYIENRELHDKNAKEATRKYAQ